MPPKYYKVLHNISEDRLEVIVSGEKILTKKKNNNMILTCNCKMIE